MLSQYDRQQLELISSRLHMEDPEFARSLRDGRPRPLPTTRRWPLVVLAGLALLVLAAGVLVMSFGLIFAGGLALALLAVAYRRQAGRSPRLRVKRHRRGPRRRWG